MNDIPTLPWVYVEYSNLLILSISDFQRGQSLSSPLHLRFCLTYRYVHRIILACTPPLTVPLCSQVTILSLSHQLVVPQLLPPAAQLQRWILFEKSNAKPFNWKNLLKHCRLFMKFCHYVVIFGVILLLCKRKKRVKIVIGQPLLPSDHPI